MKKLLETLWRIIVRDIIAIAVLVVYGERIDHPIVRVFGIILGIWVLIPLVEDIRFRINRKKCSCNELEYTNQYADSWKCKKCGKIYLNKEGKQ